MNDEQIQGKSVALQRVNAHTLDRIVQRARSGNIERKYIDQAYREAQITGDVETERDLRPYVSKLSREDVDYDAAVRSGDKEQAGWMVNRAAKDAGAITTKTGRSGLHLYHGTPSFGFTEFRPGVIFLTDNPYMQR